MLSHEQVEEIRDRLIHWRETLRGLGSFGPDVARLLEDCTALCDGWLRLEEENGRLREAILKHGSHAINCGRIDRPHLHKGVACDSSHPCDCGWEALHRAVLRKEEGDDVPAPK